jgi:iron complex outermembrane receptor protein
LKLGAATLAEIGAWRLQADAMADAVKATISGVGPAPPIPPLRVLGGLTLSDPRWDLRGEVEHVTAQNRIAAQETPTAAYTLVNAEFGFKPGGKDGRVSFTPGARNLFNRRCAPRGQFLATQPV